MSLSLFSLGFFFTQVCCDFTELFESGFEIFDDFLGKNIGIRKVIGFFESGFVAVRSEI